jgi:DUF1680 family protein
VAARGAKVSKDNRGFVIVEKKWKAGDTLRLTLNPSITPHKAVDGTSAISYGPLVFALPVPAKAEIVQQFPQAEAAGLHGLDAYQFDPADLASAKRPLKWSSAERSYGLRVVADTTADPLHPWDKSPLQLRGRMIRAEGKTEKVTLVPMGCTILRRTCF